MVDKELRKLSRRELVEVIYQMKKNEQQMKEEIVELREALQDKRIRITEAGSIAEAAAKVNEYFSTAQATADLYLQEIACMKEDTAAECEKIIAEAKKKAEEIRTLGADILENIETYRTLDEEKWLQFQKEMLVLENLQNQNLFEDAKNGKKS